MGGEGGVQGGELPDGVVTGPPPPPTGILRLTFDGALVGPIVPPPPPRPLVPAGPMPEPVSAEILAIPLGIKELLRQSLDLLTRSDAGLRGASFYIGFILLVTVAPLAVLFGVGLALGGDTFGDGFGSTYDYAMPAWLGWSFLAGLPASLGYVAATTEARALATAVIGGRVEGRPLRLRASIAIARKTFWQILGVQILLGFLSGIASLIAQFTLLVALGPVAFINTGVSLLLSLAISAPFVYVPAGIVLGEVGALEAISRSFRLVWLRKRLALVVTMFGVLGQFIVLFGISSGADIVARLVVGSGLAENFPALLVVPIAVALVFSFGTLTFLVEAIAAAPAVHAFEALTHYTHGLEVGRRNPVRGTRIWNPWLTPGLALCAGVALLALVAGLLSLCA